MATTPEVLADLSGPLGGKVGRVLFNSDLVRRIWSSVRELRNIHGPWAIGGGNGERGPEKLAKQDVPRERGKSFMAVWCGGVAGT